MSSDVPQRWTKYVLTNILVSSCNLEWSRRKQFLLELTLKSYATLVSEAVVHIKVCTKPHYQKCWCTNVTDYEISLKVAYIWHAVTAIAPRSHPHTDMQCMCIILHDEQNTLFIHYPCMYAYIACKPPVHAHTKIISRALLIQLAYTMELVQLSTVWRSGRFRLLVQWLQIVKEGIDYF